MWKEEKRGDETKALQALEGEKSMRRFCMTCGSTGEREKEKVSLNVSAEVGPPILACSHLFQSSAD